MALRIFTWCVNAGATRTTKPKTNTVQFGDGYKQVSSFGINNIDMAWSVAKTGKLAEIEAIHQFLRDHNGVTPFYLNIRGATKTYRTVGDFDETHLGADVWQISFNIEQAFLP